MCIIDGVGVHCGGAVTVKYIAEYPSLWAVAHVPLLGVLLVPQRRELGVVVGWRALRVEVPKLGVTGWFCGR